MARAMIDLRRFPHIKVLCPALLTLQVLCAAPIHAQSTYPTRVRAIATDVRWSLASLYSSWEKFQDEREELRAPKRSTDVESMTKAHIQTKAALLAAMKKMESNATRLRSISPVPMAWKKWDNKLINAAWDFARGSEHIETWLLQPSAETKNAAGKHLRRAQSTLDGVLQEIQRRTDTAIIRKKYTP